MSRIQSQVQNKVQNKGQTQAQTPFCKVCFDSGKSVSEYTSHYPRQSPSPQSPVVCPTILSNECSYCHNKGHLPSCCPALKTKNKVDKIKERETLRKVYQEEEKKQKEVKKAKVTNVFAALESDDEEIDVKKVSEQKVSQKKVSEEKVKEEYPALPTTKKPVTTTTTQPAVPFSYSSMAAKPAFIKETPKTRPVAVAVAVASAVEYDFEEEEELYRKAREEVLSRKKPLLASQINWGTTVDSDSDEDW